MSDLIDRQAAIDAIDVKNVHKGIISALQSIIRELPSAQPVARDTNVLSNDTISRQAAVEELYKMLHDCFWADDEELDAVITTLNELPSAQPEIIRCKDCKWYNDRERTCNDLMSFGRYWKPDDFCSYGKRRTDE